MKHNFLYFVLITLLISACSSDIDDVADEVTRTASSINGDFDEAKFRAAVDEEVERTLRRAGQENLVELTRELMAKEDEIRSKLLDLKKMEEELEASKRAFQSQVSEFRSQQDRFIGCVDQAERDIENRVRHMVNVVSGMRPQNAAEVLSVQDSEIAVQILSQLDPENIARIFNQMDKEISARLQKQYMNMKK